MAAITQASRRAFRDLSAIADSDASPEIRQLALSEVMRVKAFWISVSRTAAITIDKDGKAIKPSDLKTCEVVEEVLHNPNWPVRAVLSLELGGRRTEKVPEALLEVVERDDNLEVVRDAVNAWSLLTGYHSPDVFGSPHVADWWKENRESFRTGLSKSEPCP